MLQRSSQECGALKILVIPFCSGKEFNVVSSIFIQFRLKVLASPLKLDHLFEQIILTLPIMSTNRLKALMKEQLNISFSTSMYTTLVPVVKIVKRLSLCSKRGPITKPFSDKLAMSKCSFLRNFMHAIHW